MPTLEINIAQSNRTLIIKAPVTDSLHASRLTDRINNLPYLKVYERTYKAKKAEIKCHTIRGIYSIEKLHADLDTMSDLINLPNETN
jgi:hypothetical protein